MRSIRPRITLRAKLLLASSLLLALPYAGYQYVNEMERYLREGFEAAVLGAARAVAGALHGRASLLAPDGGESPPEHDIFVHTLVEPPQIDGYVDDWGRLTEEMQVVGDASGFGFSYVAGQHGGYLYLILSVRDDRVVYSAAHETGTGRSDHLEIGILRRGGTAARYLIDTAAPGWTRATAVEQVGRTLRPGARAYPIRGEWRALAGGYLVELRLPLEMLGAGMWLAAVDVDDRDERAPWLRLATSEPPRANPLDHPVVSFGRVLLASQEIDRVLSSLGATAGRRIWVVDGSGRVRARGGSLARPAPAPAEGWPASWLGWVLSGPAVEEDENVNSVSRLSGPAVATALTGNEAIRWRAGSGPGDLAIVTAGHPIRAGEAVIGAVVVEEASQPIQTARRRALVDLFGATLLSSVLAAAVFLVFATRLGARIRSLRDAAERAIDGHGRVVAPFAAPLATDEIGDLGRSFAEMLERLRRYHQHLEQLAGRLSHELRTPIAVVRSSLENLERSSPEEAALYSARAMDGITRLAGLVTRMSEATRIEQAIEAAEVIHFDLAAVLRETVDGYRAAWPERRIEGTISEGATWVSGVPDLFVQLMDKLVANGLEFSAPGAPVRVGLERGDGRAVVRVGNQGPPIPERLRHRLFDSLVSERPPGDAGTTHLGLGLYVARLIAEFHRGTIRAANVDEGVEVTVWLPRSEPPEGSVRG